MKEGSKKGKRIERWKVRRGLQVTGREDRTVVKIKEIERKKHNTQTFLGAVHTNAGIFETVCFSAWFGLSSTRNRSCELLKPEFFVTGVQGELF